MWAVPALVTCPGAGADESSAEVGYEYVLCVFCELTWPSNDRSASSARDRIDYREIPRFLADGKFAAVNCHE